MILYWKKYLSPDVLSFANKRFAIKKYQLIKSHLEEFGLEFFNTESDYFVWADKLFERNFKKLGKDINKYITTFEKHSADPENERITKLFFDIAASHNLFIKILHSIKSVNIAQSCMGVIDEITDNSNILDLGCNVGYLSSFYAKHFPNSLITGIDVNKKSILKAREINQNIKNLEFFNNYEDIKNKKFDFIIDTQCLSTLHDENIIKETIKKVRNLTKDKCKLISISNIVSAEHYDELISLFNKNNFYIYELYPFPVEALDDIEIYTKLILTEENKKINVNASTYFQDNSNFLNSDYSYEDIEEVKVELQKKHYYN